MIIGTQIFSKGFSFPFHLQNKSFAMKKAHFFESIPKVFFLQVVESWAEWVSIISNTGIEHMPRMKYETIRKMGSKEDSQYENISNLKCISM